ncbi:hypothetical protein CMV_001408 [Castanea mollissima]|uniref:Uncharacterized protein n=1 Tax=Castanea mollissima TaxID=60419 RepID=A0A8J4RX57_9ROSI|nr:hypothetical protein CMV_001408 [Castanea mollissima]
MFILHKQLVNMEIRTERHLGISSNNSCSKTCCTHQQKDFGSLSDSRTTIPAGRAQAENDHLQIDPSNGRIKTVNHALIARPWFIHQVWGPGLLSEQGYRGTIL